MNHHTFISGGSKNGKSMYAQRAAQAGGKPLYYIATMISADAEDDARIARHIRERDGWGFETIECGRNILSCLDNADPNGSFLLDSITALLANEMFQGSIYDPNAGERVADELEMLIKRVRSIVLVSDFLYADPGPYDDMTENYRRSLALIDRRVAQCCDNVLECSFANVICHKGRIPI